MIPEMALISWKVAKSKHLWRENSMFLTSLITVMWSLLRRRERHWPIQACSRYSRQPPVAKKKIQKKTVNCFRNSLAIKNQSRQSTLSAPNLPTLSLTSTRTCKKLQTYSISCDSTGYTGSPLRWTKFRAIQARRNLRRKLIQNR